MAEHPLQTLPSVLAFDPDWIKDPPPWVLRFLEKDAVIKIAIVRMELEKSLYAAQIKAVEQLHGLLQKELQGR